MDRAGFLEQQFLKRFKAEPTPCQARLFRDVADFVTCDDADILVVNGYAGTGKTTAISAVIAALKDVGTPSVLLAPTGRAAKVLSGISRRPAYTIHKHIYRQKSVGSDGFGQFSLAPTRPKEPFSSWMKSPSSALMRFRPRALRPSAPATYWRIWFPSCATAWTAG